MVASMGPLAGPEMSQLFAVSRSTKRIISATGGNNVGKLGGLEVGEDGNYYVTDWTDGKFMLILRSGEAQDLLDLQGAADLEYIPEKEMLIIPILMNDKIVAYNAHSH